MNLLDGCLEWIGPRVPWDGQVGGYGVVAPGGQLATEFVWQIENPDLMPGQALAQRCENPLCVAIEHLYLVTTPE